ncbi:MAG: transglutaminase family protein, partial [Oscillospiraceae bacterium]
YFTQVRYRSLGSMLCILFPFVIYAKRDEPMSDLKIAVLITLFLAVMVHNRQIDAKKNNVQTVFNLSYVISIALFVSFVGAAAMVIPKPEMRSALEKNSHAFDFVAEQTNASSDYENLSNVSSPRYGASYTNEILFYFASDYEMPVYYLKRQGYDNFYGDRWHLDNSTDKYLNYERYSAYITRDNRYEQMKALALTEKYNEYGLTADKFQMDTPSISSFRVFDEDFQGYYIPAPNGVTAGTYNLSASNDYFSYVDGEIAVMYVENDYDYTLDYFPESDEYRSYVQSLGLTARQYRQILTDAGMNGEFGEDEFWNELNLAEEYYTNVDYNEVSERMYDLAMEITKDCVSDYDKAQALCDYFEENGYIYDLEYTPDDTSIEYFLFESKTGSCTSYATAMTLMARMCGLPARYVEGFAAYERTDSGSIAVRDAHAHAYVEVYIPGGGWMTFDPTVSGYMIDYSKKSGFDFAAFAQYMSKILIFLGVIFFVVFILLIDRIVELFFRIRLRFAKSDKRIILLYAHIIRLLEFSSKDDLSAYTANMLIAYVRERRGTSVEYCARLFEKTCFGGIDLSDNEFSAAYEEYKTAYRYLRKIPKDKK